MCLQIDPLTITFVLSTCTFCLAHPTLRYLFAFAEDILGAGDVHTSGPASVFLGNSRIGEAIPIPTDDQDRTTF